MYTLKTRFEKWPARQSDRYYLTVLNDGPVDVVLVLATRDELLELLLVAGDDVVLLVIVWLVDVGLEWPLLHDSTDLTGVFILRDRNGSHFLFTNIWISSNFQYGGQFLEHMCAQLPLMDGYKWSALSHDIWYLFCRFNIQGDNWSQTYRFFPFFDIIW